MVCVSWDREVGAWKVCAGGEHHNGVCHMTVIIGATILVPSLIARFIGPTWGPSGADRTQLGPMLAPWTLLSGLLWSQVIATHLKIAHPKIWIYGCPIFIWVAATWHQDRAPGCHDPILTTVWSYHNIETPINTLLTPYSFIENQ